MKSIPVAPMICALSALLIPCIASSVDSASAPAAQQRPRIGLVLAGGGAKGGAHIGVLKVLEELHVPVDCIAGTSMGALIGGGYASGQSAAEIETFVKGIDWSAVVGGIGRRTFKPAEENRLASDSYTSIELGLRNGKIVTPAGIVDTSDIDDVLRTYVAHARLIDDFDELPIPYRAIATDMISGNMVVLDSGDLATAMRASMAIPGAFSPVALNGQILVDGGMVRNIPIDIARATCADVVIVVNLIEPPASPDKLVQAQQLLARSMDVMLKANEVIQLDTMTERDIRIDVQMGDIGTADFERLPETIPLGEAAARSAAGRLAVLAAPETEYMAWRQRVTTGLEIERRIADVRFEGLNRVNSDYLRSLSKIRPGDSVDIAAVSADARRMAALDDLESVAYRLESNGSDTTLVWLPTEASIGRDVIRPSVGMYADGGGDLKFQVGVQHVRSWLNDRGGQWRNTIQLGYESLLSTSWYQPFDLAQKFFIEPELFGSRTAESLYNNGDHVATYRFVDLGGRVDFGWNMAQAAQMRIGYWASNRDAKVQTGLVQLPEASALDAGPVASLRYDSRNVAGFATSGMAAALEFQRSDSSLGADRDWQRLEAGLRTAVSIGKNIVWVSVAGGTDLGDSLPGDRTFSLGGPRTLPANQYDEVRVSEYWIADASMLWHLKDLVPVKGQAFYAALGLYAAGLYNRVDPVADKEVFGVSAYLAGSTPIGAINLGVGADSDDWSVWLSIGRPIGQGSILDGGLFQ